MVYIVMVNLLELATNGHRLELQQSKIVMPDLTGNFDQMKTEKEETIKFDKNTLLWLLNHSSIKLQTIIKEIEANNNNEINVKHDDNVYFKKNSTNTTLSDAGIYKSEIIIDTGKSNQKAGYIFKPSNNSEFVIQFTNGPTIYIVNGLAIVVLEKSTMYFEYITNYSTKTIQQIKLGEGTLYVRIFSNENKEYGFHLNEKDKLVVDGEKYSFGGKELTGDQSEKVKEILNKQTIEEVKSAPSANWSGKALSTAAAIGIGTSLAYLYKKSKKSRKTISSSRSSSRVKSLRKKRRRSLKK